MSDRKRRRDDEMDVDQPRSEEWVTFRLLCPSDQIGHIIGKGGEIVKKIRSDTGATVRIDDALRGDTERVITISARDTPGSEYCPAQEALFTAVEKIFEESTEEVAVRILIDRSQTGGVIGKDGKTIKDLREKTGANIKIYNNSGKPACASAYEDLLQISGVFKYALEATKLASERLRQTAPKVAPPPSEFRGPPRMPPPAHRRPPMHPPHGEPPADNPSFATDGFVGPVESEFRLLIPDSHIGTIIGKAGRSIKQLREETGARLVVKDAPQGTPERVVECVSVEDAGSRFVASIEAVLAVLGRIFDDERNPLEPPMVRMLLPNSQVGAVLGRGGSTIKQIRQETGTQVVVQSLETPPGGREGDEVLQIEGSPSSCINAIKIVTFALHGHMIRTQAQPAGPGRRFDGPPPGMYPPHMAPPMGPHGDYPMGPRGMPGPPTGLQSRTKLLISDNQVGMLLGNHGANINQIRKISGARVKVPDERSADGEREIEISGSLEQTQSAQNLIAQVLGGANLY